MRHAIFAVLLTPFAPGLAAAEPPVATARAEIQALLDAQVTSWNRGDLGGYLEGYWRSPELVFQSGSTVTKGWDATLERYKTRYQSEGREMGKLSFEALEVEVVAPDAAFVRGAWRLEMKDDTRPHGLFTLVLRRKAGAWRIVHDHTS